MSSVAVGEASPVKQVEGRGPLGGGTELLVGFKESKPVVVIRKKDFDDFTRTLEHQFRNTIQDKLIQQATSAVFVALGAFLFVASIFLFVKNIRTSSLSSLDWNARLIRVSKTMGIGTVAAFGLASITYGVSGIKHAYSSTRFANLLWPQKALVQQYKIADETQLQMA